MRLLGIRPAGFRAFGNSGCIDLDADLVVCVGANGTGKTSLAEAIEWLFYGETRRKKRGDGYSKLEYKDSYANAHYRGAVEVEARIRFSDGAVRTLVRRLPAARSGSNPFQILVDGRPGDWQSLGVIPDEVAYPVITQHGLQEFIHVAPKDRREAISALLGLEAVTAFKSALDRARTALHRSRPPELVEADAVLRDLRGRIAASPAMAELVRGWEEDLSGVRYPADWRALVGADQKALGVNEQEPARLVAVLQAKGEKMRARLLDVEKLRFPADLVRRAENLRDQAESLETAISAATEAARKRRSPGACGS